MESAQLITCRHEFVKIFQRKLKGLERRMVATRAYLPIGFKMTDFSHLGEGSYCFCSKCRTRLFPKRTNAEKAQARLLLAKKNEGVEVIDPILVEASLVDLKEELGVDASLAPDLASDLAPDSSAEQMLDDKETPISVEELELESTDLADLNEGSVNIEADDACNLGDDEV